MAALDAAAAAKPQVPETHGTDPARTGRAYGRFRHIVSLLLNGTLGPPDQEPSADETKAATDPVADIGTPDALRTLAAGAEARLEHDTGAERDQAELAEKQKVKLLLRTHLNDAIWSDLLLHVRPAAQRGESQLELIRFPSDLCTDGGRKIRVREGGWEDTLQGEPAELRARYQRDLLPKGFGLAASTLEYQQGMPGDIGLFLTWHG